MEEAVPPAGHAGRRAALGAHWYPLLRTYWLRVLLTLGLLAIFFGNQGFRSLVGNWLELRKLSGEIAALEAENAKAESRLKELRDSGPALEREARKVGFIRNGEIEYRFDPPKEP